jgi:exonuclease VII small subunit
MKNHLKRFEEWSMNENEWDAETMAEIEQMEIREAIDEYHKWRKTVNQLEDELSHAEGKLQDAIDKLDMMNVVEYE